MRLLVTCEHASGALPDGADLGLSAEVLASHVSMDRGAATIARELARLTGAPLHVGRYSRLWVDLNRREGNPAVILAETYGLRVPGNERLTDEEREARIAAVHRPYREAALADARRLAAEGHCLHLSMHSFDPSLDPEGRAFDCGVLFDLERTPERELARALAEQLRSRGDDVRLNEPYHGVPEGLTSWLRERLPKERYSGIEVEASQGWMDGPDALRAFAARVARSAGSVETP